MILASQSPPDAAIVMLGTNEGDIVSLLQNIYDYIKSGETDTENLGLEIEHV